MVLLPRSVGFTPSSEKEARHTHSLSNEEPSIGTVGKPVRLSYDPARRPMYTPAPTKASSDATDFTMEGLRAIAPLTRKSTLLLQRAAEAAAVSPIELSPSDPNQQTEDVSTKTRRIGRRSYRFNPSIAAKPAPLGPLPSLPTAAPGAIPDDAPLTRPARLVVPAPWQTFDGSKSSDGSNSSAGLSPISPMLVASIVEPAARDGDKEIADLERSRHSTRSGPPRIRLDLVGSDLNLDLDLAFLSPSTSPRRAGSVDS